MGQIKLIGSIFLITLFSIAIISYATNFTQENETPFNFSDEGRVSSSSFSSEADSFMVQVNSTSQAYAESTVETGDEVSTTGGVFKALTGTFSSIKNIIGMAKNVLFGGEQGIGGPGIVLTALGTFISILIILYSWKTWTGKNPD